MRKTITLLATLGLWAGAASAQIDPGMAKIKILLDKVESGMQEIDKLLLQTASKGNAAAAKEAAGATAKRLEELMKQLQSSQDSVGKDMTKLIEEIERMRQQQQQQQQQQQSQDDSGDPQQGKNRPQPDQDQRDQQRGQHQDQVPTPDMVRQNDPKQQQQPKPGQPQNPQPQGTEKDKERGQNQPGQKVPQGEEEKTPHVPDNQRWGNLPKYLEFMHMRGGMPEVPEKYRRYYEAYLKTDLAKPDTKAPAEKR